MSDFIQDQGPAFLAHLLRRLADELVNGAAAWYPQAGVTAAPRTTSTLLALHEHGSLGVTEIASLLQQSHPLVITWIRQLSQDGFVRSRGDGKDARRSVIVLTAKGKQEVARLGAALSVMREASQTLMDEAAPGLFDALWRMQNACRKKPFATRLEQVQSRRHRSSGKR